jgi:SNF2 family DNA or RNA helicase
LDEVGIKHVRIDGKMTRQSRSACLKKFSTDPNVTVFLISIKAGGVGLNLVSANRVYLMEPYWNPSIENQAIDRVYRLGQTKPVTTIRFIINDSVEKNMQKRQSYKIALAEKALTDDEFKGKKRKRGRDMLLKEKVESLAILFE